MYDYLIVGAGLTGAIFAYEAKQHGKRVLVIDKRSHIAGNIYDENISGIQVHKYGPHIFHTNDECVWEYMNKFTKFNRFTNTPIANYHGKIYSLPFSMYTFNQIWGVVTPEEARAKIEEQRKQAGITQPQNLEEQAISLVGRDIYEILIKGYTEKQWGRPCNELPAFIINRLPVRFTYDSNYFNAKHQGIPVDGYTKIIEKMLEGIEVMTDTNFFTNRAEFQNIADTIFFTGQIDEYFDYILGTLEYRSLRFETEIFIDTNNFQGSAIVNYTDRETPFTRCVEHKHFYPGLNVPGTVITREFSSEWKTGAEPYYPVNNYKNNKLANDYREMAKTKAPNVIFAGRLGEYFYCDMDIAVIKATQHAFDNFGNIL